MSRRERKNRIPRSERSIRCEKPGSCLNNDGEVINRCNDAPDYRDYASPTSEMVCSRVAGEVKLDNVDRYKEKYVVISNEIDVAIADRYLSPKQIDIRFGSIQAKLEKLTDVRLSIDDSGQSHLRTIEHTDVLDKGRLSYHISARMLHAALGVYCHRALRPDSPLPPDIMRATHSNYVEVLQDFLEDGLYAKHPAIVAHKRTEIESFAALSRLMVPSLFPQPALHREEASWDAQRNHDGIIIPEPGEKIAISVKNSDYKNATGSRRAQDIRTPDERVLFIYQDVVGLDPARGQRISYSVNPSSPTSHIDDEPFPYEEYDPEISQRYVRWGASISSNETGIDEPFVFVQQINGSDGNGLMKAIIDEARGIKLSTDQQNLLNGASHFLLATIRQKTAK